MISDCKIALRSLRRSPVHSAVVVLTLALGLGTATALFLNFAPLLFPALSYSRPGQLVTVTLRQPGTPWPMILSVRHVEAYRDCESFGAIAFLQSQMMNVLVDGAPHGLYGAAADANFFSLLGVRFAQGRGFRADETQAGADTVAIVTWAFARGMDENADVLGREIIINERPRRIVGILPESWRPLINLPHGAVFVPLVLPKGNEAAFVWLHVVARLRDGATAEQAEADLLRRELPPASAQMKWLENYRPSVRAAFGLGEQHWTRRYRTMQWMGVAAIGCLHLLACVNAGSLLLIRALGRRRELGIRFALGGGRWQVMRPLVAEGALVTVAATALGWMVARWVVPPLLAHLVNAGSGEPVTNPLQSEAEWFLVLLSLLTGLGVTLLPLWRVGRLEVSEVVKEGAQTVGEPPRLRQLRGALVVIETALAVLLLTGAGLFVRTFQQLQDVRRGFETQQRAMVRMLPIPTLIIKSMAERTERYERAAAAIGRVPGVTAAALTSAATPRTYAAPNQFKIHAGEDTFDTDQDIDISSVSPDFLDVAGVPTLLGRPLATFKRGDPSGLIINAAFARKYFPAKNPLGARVEISPKEQWEIVGVVGDTVTTRGDVGPRCYYPHWQNGRMFPTEILVRHEGALSAELEKAIRRASYDVEPGFAVTEIKSLDVVLGNEAGMERYASALLKMLSVFALMMAAVGLFATLAFAVAERRGEFAIRLTLGATPGEVARLVLARGIALAVGGVLLGLGLAAGTARMIGSLLFGVEPLDPVTYGAVGLLMLAIAVPACWLPAWRAARVDPARVLRDE